MDERRGEAMKRLRVAGLAMGLLGQRFPAAQFLITGLLGPRSNAHGPNEFLEIGTGKRLTACVARVLADHATRR